MPFRLMEYIKLLQAFRNNGYSLGPVKTYFNGATGPFVFLRHDVDRMVFRAVRMAREEHALKISSTYYFRCDKAGKFPASHIKRIAELGHEIGFHYETGSRTGGDLSESRAQFTAQLTALRDLVDIQTVASHGSPLSRHSNVEVVEDIDFKGLGLLGEPGVDFDFSEVLYITDTGGVFGSPHNIRDKVAGKTLCTPTTPAELRKRLNPRKEPLILLNSHPERWPATRLGLLQARITDCCINTAKMKVNRLRIL